MASAQVLALVVGRSICPNIGLLVVPIVLDVNHQPYVTDITVLIVELPASRWLEWTRRGCTSGFRALWPFATWLPSQKGIRRYEVRKLAAQEIERLEREAAERVREQGWTVMGRARVGKASPYDRAKSFEPIRSRNLTFAVVRYNRAPIMEAVLQFRGLRRLCRLARERWRRGCRDVPASRRSSG